MSVAARFGVAIEEAALALSGVSEDESRQPVRPGGWLRKEELGHLLDSVQNNEQRIVLAALNGSYSGPEYAQNAWVALHGYREMLWAELLSLWLARNQMLHRVIERIPEEAFAATLIIGENPAMSLREWIDDYLQHMAGHVGLITAPHQ